MQNDPRKDSDHKVSDLLSGFNAEQIVDDPDDLDPDDERDRGLAATPDSPNPI